MFKVLPFYSATARLFLVPQLAAPAWPPRAMTPALACTVGATEPLIWLSKAAALPPRRAKIAGSAAVNTQVDLSYISRFWTQFEAWLSMQEASQGGLLGAPEAQRRLTVASVHGANQALMAATLVDMWGTRSPEEAREVLAAPDVLVTKQSDDATICVQTLTLLCVPRLRLMYHRL